MIGLDQAPDADGVVVVVDVLRAFTTAAIALQRGAREVWPVGTVDEAMALRHTTTGSLVMGEVGGLPVDGFDLSNSPTEMSAADVAGRVLVQRTSNGTQGLVRAVAASHRFAASFACAGATADALRALDVRRVSFVITGRDLTGPSTASESGGQRRDGDEDLACAEYIAALLDGQDVDPGDYTPRVATSSSGRRFADPAVAALPLSDLEIAQQVDLVDFALPVASSDGRLRLRAGRRRGAAGAA